MRVITSANKEMSEEVLKKYREKKNKKNEKRIIAHFTEEGSRNRVHPMRLTKSNPYLL